ncbi:MAG: zinc-ribbon domain-containing protein [Ruminococcaceae bacterium]|nr:zinc-ribbon domain-containing protein [Oscillospiraceae bacterium]
MENYIGKICPFCKTEITEADAVKVCPACGIPHHEGCWEENHGCTTFGCSEQHYEAQHTNPTDVCTNCGAPLGDGQAFCPKCGTPKAAAPQKNVCGKCGNELQDGQEFCPKCGQKAGLAVDSNVNAAINQFNAGVQQATAKKKKTPLIIAIAAIAVVVVIIIAISGGGGGSKGPDFEKLYDEYCTSIWADVGSDGSYLSIDTNPYEKDDDGLAYPAAYTAIKEVNKALGLPESVISEMGETTSADGKQTETFEEQGVTVSWKYHPDKGLEVTYKKIG